MKLISLELNTSSDRSLYIQIYEQIRDMISSGEILSGDRLPSVRMLSEMTGVSTTTVRAAYDQLVVEGYLVSRPQSGFYATEGAAASGRGRHPAEGIRADASSHEPGGTPEYTDPEIFDFVKWKKCMASVLNESSELLLTTGDRQGEYVLREEISSYLYTSRGVVSTPDEIVISAGTQQLMNHLARILRIIGIGHVCTEDPGYMPVRSIFRERGFSMSHIPVADDGIVLEKLPVNIRTAVYISPQNQFPTGAVMPIARRHEILSWAEDNDSILIEDDYDSELRYTGQPVPALQGLDTGGRVVYLGSFTSTLFPAVRISYMVLPRALADVFSRIKLEYDQTCSKTEQLTLAEFMKRGYYQINLRRVRKLYSRKLQTVTAAVRKYGKDAGIRAQDASSGMNMILSVHRSTDSGDHSAADTAEEIALRARELGLKMNVLTELGSEEDAYLNFYYNQIPLDDIDDVIREVFTSFRSAA